MSPGRHHHWGLRLAAISFGFALVLLAELGLRAGGRFASPAVGTTWDAAGTHLLTDMDVTLDSTSVAGRPGLAVPAHLARGVTQNERWTTAPLPGQVRVFAFGGSTTYGLPVQREPGRTFPGRTQAWLQVLGQPAEVINLGGAGFGSTEVVRLARQLLDQGARAWVLYAGNNEYFRYSLQLAEAQRARDAPSRLESLRLVRALRVLLRTPLAAAPVGLADAAAEQRRLVARALAQGLAAPGARPTPDTGGRWHRHDRAQQAVLAHWNQSLTTLQDLAARAGATLYVVRVQPNLVAAPRLSLHAPDLPIDAARQVEALVQEAGQAEQGHDPQATQARARDALQLDPGYAAGWYWLGMGQLEQGQVEGARLSLENALSLDMDPGRPPPELSQVTDRFLATSPAQAIDLDALWSSDRAGPLGRNLFVDTCHLRPEAYDALGERIARALLPGLTASQGPLPPD